MFCVWKDFIFKLILRKVIEEFLLYCWELYLKEFFLGFWVVVVFSLLIVFIKE